jgi:hypothetical protein
MATKRWSRREAMASARPVETWPTVCDEEMTPQERERFHNRVQAMRLYLSGVPTSEITARTGVGRHGLPRLARRCLQMAPDGEIYGFRALTRYLHLKPYTRQKPLAAKRPEQRGGCSGALGALFEQYPDLENELVKNVLGFARSRRVAVFRIRACDLHYIFIRYLQHQGHSLGAWPFNTKYRGIRTIERFMQWLVAAHFSRVVHAGGDREAKAHLYVGTGTSPFLSFEEPYDAVEIDGYNIDAFLTVVVTTPEGTEVDVVLQRLWLLAVVERASTAVLAHTIVYSSEVNANDVLRVLGQAVGERWQPMRLSIPGLSYPQEGGLPSGVIPELQGALWSVTLLDGALANLSEAVRERARTRYGFVSNWGPSGHFERRPNVERCFRNIAANVFHRLPSTTGSRPHKGRAPDAEQQAVRYRIRAADAEQFLDVAFARYNATPSEGLSFLSPLEYLRQHVDEH